MRPALHSSVWFLIAIAGAASSCDSGTGTSYPDRPAATDRGPLDGPRGLEPGGPLSEAGGKLDTASKPSDGPKTLDGIKPSDGPKTLDGIRPSDGPETLDGIKLTDGPKTLDGIRPSDGPKPFDGPTLFDGPRPLDGPTLFDGPRGDGPKLFDGPRPSDALIITSDRYPFDFTLVATSDTGKYLCTGPSGTRVCACNDGIDNEGDGKTDLADPCCKHAYDDSEGGTSQCTDCIDNDGDGKIDADDFACTGPLDNDEASFATGIPGDNMDPCKQDCFFDGNSGAGDDKCEWNLKCDPASPGSYLKKSNGDPLCPYDASYKNCPATQSAVCLQTCRRITPNGCDCFGCCTLTYGLDTRSVMLTATCQPQFITDPAKCPPCTPNQDCINPCGPCEVCVGKPAPDPSCFPTTSDGGTTSTSDGGTTPGNCGADPYCGPGGVSCPVGSYCITGCCLTIDG